MTTVRAAPIDGFQLAYERHGSGPPVVLLHGWPGDRTDYRALVPLLEDGADVVVPDLRGFGESHHPAGAEPHDYAAAGQARSVMGLIDELELDRPVLAGYDIGSRIAQRLARDEPDRVRGLVVSPPLPGVGRRILTPDAQPEYWYQSFHQLDLAEQLVDGSPNAVRAYLHHFWSHWAGPGFEVAEADLEHLVEVYSAPGAFTASISWYRAGSGMVALSVAEGDPDPSERIVVPTTVLLPDADPVFRCEWGDRVEDHFADATVEPLAGIGHFTPLEAPEAFARALLAAV